MIAYISQNADKKIIDGLKQEGFEVNPLAPFLALDFPINTHADTLLLALENIIFSHKDYMLEIGNLMNVKTDEHMSAKYPDDILLNIAVVGKHVFCNTKFASKTIMQYLNDNGYNIHHVSQGYAHCSTLIVSDHAIITADKGIFTEAEKACVNALLISNGHIELPPYKHGFIGGCAGATHSAVYFCGSLKHHPDGENIREFIHSNGKQVVELCDTPLVDVGGILFI